MALNMALTKSADPTPISSFIGAFFEDPSGQYTAQLGFMCIQNGTMMTVEGLKWGVKQMQNIATRRATNRRVDKNLFELFVKQIRDAQMQLRQHAASQNPLATRQAVGSVRENMPHEVLVQGPLSSTMARNYRNYVVHERAERGDDQLDLAETAQIAIPDYLLPKFIFDGLVDGVRMFVFATEQSRIILARFGQHVAIDGTFKYAPANFMQLYTISALVDKVAVPCVYGILRSKSVNTYNAMLAAVANRVPEWHPESFMLDFEASAHSAVNQVHKINEHLLLPENSFTTIFVCFSMNFQILRKLRLVHYIVLNWIGCRDVMGIPPIDEFDEEGQYGAYGYVDQHIRNWIEASNYQFRAALFSMNIWNMCERLELDLVRTNNSMESWHRNLNAQFRSQSPRLSEFLRIIRQEDKYWHRQMQEFDLNPAYGVRGKGMKRKQVYVEQDANIRQIVATRGDRHPLQYLRAIAYSMPDPL